MALDSIIYNNRIEYHQYSVFTFPNLYRMIHYLWIKSIKKEIGLYMKGRKIISVRIAYRYRKSLYQTIQYHKKADTWQSARYLLEFAEKLPAWEPAATWQVAM
jgi:hypothetical protein